MAVLLTVQTLREHIYIQVMCFLFIRCIRRKESHWSRPSHFKYFNNKTGDFHSNNSDIKLVYVNWREIDFTEIFTRQTLLICLYHIESQTSVCFSDQHNPENNCESEAVCFIVRCVFLTEETDPERPSQGVSLCDGAISNLAISFLMKATHQVGFITTPTGWNGLFLLVRLWNVSWVCCFRSELSVSKTKHSLTVE